MERQQQKQRKKANKEWQRSRKFRRPSKLDILHIVGKPKSVKVTNPQTYGPPSADGVPPTKRKTFVGMKARPLQVNQRMWSRTKISKPFRKMLSPSERREFAQKKKAWFG